MGTDLQHKVVPMHSVRWSAAALLTHQDTLRQIHADYARATAGIITNAFSTARHILEPGIWATRLSTQHTGRSACA